MGFDNFILGPLSINYPLTDRHTNGQTDRQIDNKSEIECWDEVTDRSLSDSSLHQGQLKCDGTCAETRFSLSAKRTSPFKSAGASVQSTAGSRGVRISGRNAAYTMFRGSVKSTVYSPHSLVSPSLPVPCITVCHHISNGVYIICLWVLLSARSWLSCNLLWYKLPHTHPHTYTSASINDPASLSYKYPVG